MKPQQLPKAISLTINSIAIKTSDCLIDMSRAAAGVGAGTPEGLAANPASFTGKYLKRLLNE
jgi:excinuclease ABC subunit A